MGLQKPTGLTVGFDRFTSAAELCTYSGLTLVIRQSGSSVKGRPRIRKIGNQKFRNLLFMGYFNICKLAGRDVQHILQRFLSKNSCQRKSKKIALIGVCNTLLKQAFATAKSGLIYCATYRSTLVRN
jgi:transposase